MRVTRVTKPLLPGRSAGKPEPNTPAADLTPGESRPIPKEGFLMRCLPAYATLLALLTCAPGFAQDADPVPTANRTRVPNFLGATGLLYTPSAYVLGDRTFSGHVHANSDFFGGGVLGGFGDRFEAGLTVLDADDANRSFFDRDGTEFLLNAKLNVVREGTAMPAVSIGVIDALNELKQDSSWYVVASKYFTRGDTDQDFALVGHVGYGDGIFDDDLFAGAQLLFDENLSAMAEYQDGKFNLGARFQSRGFAGTVGFFDLKHLGAGLSYSASF